ncbi:hypothetical protein HELRODRAFT_172713 [Helobdella robusta]|uniref:Uncharacterized protein n=1 Tax=Helobdella robusta TaxID=6412 RepID=T1F5U2_HELRO|nr:hypothetical protein HELRODRAFT_172713 [Helobdella robusta]ESO04347.1 hypothetical protein HELRODRAFT_172713 [Helobdella robusta]
MILCPHSPRGHLMEYISLHPIFWGSNHQGHNHDGIYGINVNLDISHTYRSHVLSYHLGVVAPPPPTNSTSTKNITRKKNKFMKSELNLKTAAITKYINTLIINFNSKTFTNIKRGSEAIWDQVNKIRGSDKSFNTPTSQHIDTNTLNTYMSTDLFYQTPPTKSTTINNHHQHQQPVLHMLKQACPTGIRSRQSTIMIASAREQDMEIYEKRKGQEQLDEQRSKKLYLKDRV